MSTLVILSLFPVLGLGFLIGLLVGRKNPGIANAAATISNAAKAKLSAPVQTEADKIVAAVTPLVAGQVAPSASVQPAAKTA